MPRGSAAPYRNSSAFGRETEDGSGGRGRVSGGGREVWELVVIGIGWGVSRIGGGLKECRFGFCVFVIGGW